jgi:hypothetical protein
MAGIIRQSKLSSWVEKSELSSTLTVESTDMGRLLSASAVDALEKPQPLYMYTVELINLGKADQ